MLTFLELISMLGKESVCASHAPLTLLPRMRFSALWRENLVDDPDCTFIGGLFLKRQRLYKRSALIRNELCSCIILLISRIQEIKM